MSDQVEHPDHYTSRKVECIEITQWLMCCQANVVKYVYRHEYKGKPLEDLRKARWYMSRALSLPIPPVNTGVVEPLAIYLEETGDVLTQSVVQLAATGTSYEDYETAINYLDEKIAALEDN